MQMTKNFIKLLAILSLLMHALYAKEKPNSETELFAAVTDANQFGIGFDLSKELRFEFLYQATVDTDPIKHYSGLSLRLFNTKKKAADLSHYIGGGVTVYQGYTNAPTLFSFIAGLEYKLRKDLGLAGEAALVYVDDTLDSINTATKLLLKYYF